MRGTDSRAIPEHDCGLLISGAGAGASTSLFGFGFIDITILCGLYLGELIRAYKN
jgi:hypothetical protein